MKKKLIQSVLRAIEILDIVSGHRKGIKLKDISDKLGLGSSTVFYLVSTLMEKGFIKQGIDNKYKLGPKNLQLGNSYLDNLSIYKSAVPGLENILKQFNENAYLYIIEEYDLLELAKVESSHSVKPTKVPCDKNNSHATAIGKLFLSSIPKEKFEESAGKNGNLKKYTKSTITNMNQLIKELASIKEKGYALDIEESETGVNCIAVPIYNHRGMVKACMGISIPTQRFSKDLIGKILPVLKKEAMKTSNELGYLKQ